MKCIIRAAASVLLVLSAAACGKTEEPKTAPEEIIHQAETATPDADWKLPETIEMTEEASALFDHAVEGLTGVRYEPLGYLGEKDGVYCVLCRAAVLAPDASPYYALVYVNNDGVQNIWDIWMGAHAQKKEG